MKSNSEIIKDRIDKLTRHISHVQENCSVIAKKLIDLGEQDFAIRLIAISQIHDYSKWSGIEWDYLTDESGDKKLMEAAIHQHNTTNPHHPEYWGGIANMPPIYLCELVADWAARAAEFGTSLQQWVEKGAAERFGYNQQSEIYTKIMYYAGLLCNKPFSAI